MLLRYTVSALLGAYNVLAADGMRLVERLLYDLVHNN
jgi:hypothetical protein